MVSDVLLAAAHRLRDSRVKIRYMIVGRGTDKYMKFLVKRAHSLNATYRVSFQHRIPHEQLGGIKADICAAPFRMSLTSLSSLASKVLEYLRLGVPITASRAAGLEQTLAGAVFYTKPGDSPDLARAISELCEDAAEYGEYPRRVKRALDALS